MGIQINGQTDTISASDGAFTLSGSVGIPSTTALNAAGVNVTGVVTASSFVGDGSNITGISTNYYKGEIVGFDNVIDSDIDITTDYRTAIIYVDQDLTVDIEEGATITIDDGCFLNIIS